MTYYTSVNSKKGQILFKRGAQHLDSGVHKKNQIRLGYR